MPGLQVPLLVASFLVSILAGAASTWGVARQYTGLSVDVLECYRRAWYRVLSLVAAFLIVGLVLLGAGILSVIVIGLPIFLYVLVIWFFAEQAVMIEGMGPLRAVGRSRELVKGFWWRLFGIGIVYVIMIIGLVIAALIPVGILSVGLLSSGGEGLEFAIDILASVAVALIWPVFTIGRTLVYLDLRVRTEGYTVADLVAVTVGPGQSDAPEPEQR